MDRDWETSVNYNPQTYINEFAIWVQNWQDAKRDENLVRKNKVNVWNVACALYHKYKKILNALKLTTSFDFEKLASVIADIIESNKLKEIYNKTDDAASTKLKLSCRKVYMGYDNFFDFIENFQYFTLPSENAQSTEDAFGMVIDYIANVIQKLDSIILERVTSDRDWENIENFL